ncbi:MAG: dihydrolipoamide acetyltransferase family protein [Solirubrobacterales bacterium]
MNDIVMPRLSDSMTEGTVVRWLKAPGEAIARGEPLAEIETDKATITYESDIDGVLTQILVGEGQTVPVGSQIAIVQPLGAAAQQPPSQPNAPAASPPPLPMPPEQSPAPLPTPSEFQQPAPPPLPNPPIEQAPQQPFDHQQYEPELQQPGEYQQTGEYEIAEQDTEQYDVGQSDAVAYDTGEFTTGEGAEAPSGERIKASPIARRLARRLGLDIATIAGSGPDGRIVKEDVEAAADAAASRAAQRAPTQAPATEQPFAGTQYSTEPPAQPPHEYAYEPGGSEQFEDAAFAAAAHETIPQPQQPQQPPPAAPTDPPLIPHYPPPPQAPPAYPPQGYPASAYPPPGYGPPGMPPAYPPQPAQPFPAPPPFVQGMTGNFPAVEQMGAQQPPQPPPAHQPAQQQPQQPQPPGASPTATRGHSTPIEPTSAQQTVARRMAESKATAPEFFVETEVDMTMAVAFREQLRSAIDPLPSYNDFVFKAAAMALKQYPNVNAAYKDGHFEQYSDVNIGMVVSATDLLAVPTLFNVDEKGLSQIARESHELADAVRNRSIQPAQMTGGTFSISNLGMYGVERFTAILNPPQAAILAVGAITRKAVIAEDGMSLVVRQMMAMTLTCDHRILYGAEAAEFIAAIKAWLENPQMLQV